MSSEKRKPNWSLCVRDGERWRSVGAAWETERGNLYVRLDAGEVLRGTAMLFPYRERHQDGPTAPATVPPKPRRLDPPDSMPPTAPAGLSGDYMEKCRRDRAKERSELAGEPDAPGWL